MLIRLFNNIGIRSLSIVSVADEFDRPLPISKALLIAPLVSHRALLGHLSRKNTVVSSLEKLIVKRTHSFANFNERYYDGLCESLNAIQFLVDIKVAEIVNSGIQVVEPISYEKQMGKRAAKIYKAAPNIAALLNASTSSLYSSLRVQI